MTAAHYTNVTVVAGKQIHVNVGGMGLTTYTGTQTVDLPTHEAAKLKSQGLVTYT